MDQDLLVVFFVATAADATTVSVGVYGVRSVADRVHNGTTGEGVVIAVRGGKIQN